MPPPYSRLFRGHRRLLDSHRGYDPGALALARRLARLLACRLLAATTTRLLVDLNRSLHHHHLFSVLTRDLGPAARAAVLKAHYHPYRNRVTRAIRAWLARTPRVVHVSVHSFTPSLNGRERRADIGLLYDPARRAERALCQIWQHALAAAQSDLRVRCNYPYRGVSDGFTTHLRKILPPEQYIGIELEVNQRLLVSRAAPVARLAALLAATLRQALKSRTHARDGTSN